MSGWTSKETRESRKEREQQAVLAAQSAQLNVDSEVKVSNQSQGRVLDSKPISKSKVASTNPSPCEAIDLCSDDDGDGAQNNPAQNQETTRLSKGKKGGTPPQQSQSSKTESRAIGTGASVSNVNARELQSRFKPSPEVRAYFNEDESEEESEEDEVVAEALRSVRENDKKREKKRRKRAREEKAGRNSKKRKVAPKTAEGAKKRKQSNSEAVVASSESTEKQSSLPVGTDDVKGNQPSGEYEDWSTSQLQARCVEYGLPKGGKKQDLIDRLRGPKPPKVWLERKKKGEYVPERYNTGGTALLVALYLHEREVGSEALGMTKEELYPRAEELEISKNPFSGGTTQTGPYHYDGWSNMAKLLKGDPPLVVQKKHKKYAKKPLPGSPRRALERWR